MEKLPELGRRKLTDWCCRSSWRSAERKLGTPKAAAASAQFCLLEGYSLPVSWCLTLQLMMRMDFPLRS